jgi:hypothetical protein
MIGSLVTGEELNSVLKVKGSDSRVGSNITVGPLSNVLNRDEGSSGKTVGLFDDPNSNVLNVNSLGYVDELNY